MTVISFRGVGRAPEITRPGFTTSMMGIVVDVLVVVVVVGAEIIVPAMKFGKHGRAW